jgi:hypothetical protein
MLFCMLVTAWWWLSHREKHYTCNPISSASFIARIQFQLFVCLHACNDLHGSELSSCVLQHRFSSIVFSSGRRNHRISSTAAFCYMLQSWLMTVRSTRRSMNIYYIDIRASDAFGSGLCIYMHAWMNSLNLPPFTCMERLYVHWLAAIFPPKIEFEGISVSVIICLDFFLLCRL